MRQLLVFVAILGLSACESEPEAPADAPPATSQAAQTTPTPETTVEEGAASAEADVASESADPAPTETEDEPQEPACSTDWVRDEELATLEKLPASLVIVYDHDGGCRRCFDRGVTIRADGSYSLYAGGRTTGEGDFIPGSKAEGKISRDDVLAIARLFGEHGVQNLDERCAVEVCGRGHKHQSYNETRLQFENTNIGVKRQSSCEDELVASRLDAIDRAIQKAVEFEAFLSKVRQKKPDAEDPSLEMLD